MAEFRCLKPQSWPCSTVTDKRSPSNFCIRFMNDVRHTILASHTMNLWFLDAHSPVKLSRRKVNSFAVPLTSFTMLRISGWSGFPAERGGGREEGGKGSRRSKKRDGEGQREEREGRGRWGGKGGGGTEGGGKQAVTRGKRTRRETKRGSSYTIVWKENEFVHYRQIR